MIGPGSDKNMITKITQTNLGLPPPLPPYLGLTTKFYHFLVAALSSDGTKKRILIDFSRGLYLRRMRIENCSKEKAWDEEVTRGVEKLPRAPMCLLSVICHHYNYNTKSARLHASTTDIIQ